jgi:hypothetical protein
MIATELLEPTISQEPANGQNAHEGKQYKEGEPA